ncbi:MAG: sugar phosphate nucleotidyltransferase [Brevinematales bacterium]|nr:sugar phosphate nucleotidyltransferase [Brevinematales bacterium]
MKGVIIAAGYGSRFFPVTKTIPKEMLPLYNIPSIQFAIEELTNSGIKDIIVVTSRRKKSLDDYFDIEFELENFFRGTDNEKLLRPPDANICFIRQKRMMGVGNAILEASSFIGNTPFVLLYPDDIVISKVPLTKRLVETYEKTGKNVLSLLDKSGEDVSRFGVVKISNKKNEIFEIQSIVEKPSKGSEPSSYITIGRYLFTEEFIDILKDEWRKFSGNGEFYHISSINKLCSLCKVVGIEVYKEEFFDTGTPQEYAKSFIRYLTEYSNIKEEIIKWIRNHIERL